MAPFAAGEGFTIYFGKMERVLPDLPENSVDAVICDPPYELGFMGKSWDSSGVAFQPETWAAVLRVAKPGAHLVAFGGTRTFHRLTCAIEDAGWEIRDCLSWLYGSGFPKSKDVAKAMDKAAMVAPMPRGIEDREYAVATGTGLRNRCAKCDKPFFSADPCKCPKPEPVTEEGKKWAGWGTALKPAWEPIILAKKPLAGTVAANVAAHGTGGLNIDGCRIGAEERSYTPKGIAPGQNNAVGKEWDGGGQAPVSVEGRWPANVLLDEEAARRLDEEAGDLGVSSGGRIGNAQGAYTNQGSTGWSGKHEAGDPGYGDSGGPSRFFYTAKASRSEREEGLENLAPVRRSDGRAAIDGPGGDNPRLRTSARKNDHPTVKPLDLMRWLVRLIAPPGGLVLDPFMGSGTTLKAAREEFHPCIGIDMTERYCLIAKARLSANTLPLT